MILFNKAHKTFIALLGLAAFLVACSPRPEKIEADYISPSFYTPYSCERLEEEHIKLSRKVRDLYKKQDAHVNKDIAVLSASILLFNPAIFFMIGQDEKEELSFLKGEYNALEKAAIKNKCPIADVIATEKVDAKKAEEKKLLNRIDDMRSKKSDGVNQ